MRRDKSEIGKAISIEKSITTKGLNTLAGIISGLVSDGELNDKEILYLKTWCDDNRDLATVYPASIVFRRVHEILADGIIEKLERECLLHELQTISGNFFAQTGAAMPEIIASCLDDDPTVIFPSRHFVFTGEFVFGPRSACERATQRHDGLTDANVTRKTNYLVIGSLASPAWITANFGRKIQEAAKMAESGEYDISIIRENDWAMALR